MRTACISSSGGGNADPPQKQTESGMRVQNVIV